MRDLRPEELVLKDWLLASGVPVAGQTNPICLIAEGLRVDDSEIKSLAVGLWGRWDEGILLLESLPASMVDARLSLRILELVENRSLSERVGPEAAAKVVLNSLLGAFGQIFGGYTHQLANQMDASTPAEEERPEVDTFTNLMRGVADVVTALNNRPAALAAASALLQGQTPEGQRAADQRICALIRQTVTADHVRLILPEST